MLDVLTFGPKCTPVMTMHAKNHNARIKGASPRALKAIERDYGVNSMESYAQLEKLSKQPERLSRSIYEIYVGKQPGHLDGALPIGTLVTRWRRRSRMSSALNWFWERLEA